MPGSDEKHFCQPTDVAVSEQSGVFFVADGYCNSRIMKYDRTGKLIKIISKFIQNNLVKGWPLKNLWLPFSDGHWRVPHSLALFEEEDVLCIADREGQKIDCLKAGLSAPKHADKDETGKSKLMQY